MTILRFDDDQICINKERAGVKVYRRCLLRLHHVRLG